MTFCLLSCMTKPFQKWMKGWIDGWTDRPTSNKIGLGAISVVIFFCLDKGINPLNIFLQDKSVSE